MNPGPQVPSLLCLVLQLKKKKKSWGYKGEILFCPDHHLQLPELSEGGGEGGKWHRKNTGCGEKSDPGSATFQLLDLEQALHHQSLGFPLAVGTEVC